MKLREQKGIFMPRWMIERVSDHLRSFASMNATSNPLYTSFKARLAPLGNISAGDKQALYSAVEKALRKTVYPAYRSVVAYLEGIEPHARTTDGVWALPDGEAHYRQALRHHTTTDMTPEEIHNLGLREVAHVTGEMRAELTKLGFGSGSLREGMDRVAEAGGVRRLNSQAAKDALVAEFRAVIDRADKNLSGQFDIRPKVGLEVRAVPEYKEAGAPGGFYFPPALDGSRSGIFYVNLGRQSFANYQIPTLAYHEGIPGHHFQLGIQSELTGVPTIRKTGVFPPATAYVEGWALYAEKLAAELDLYANDPYGNLGRLQAELFRAARLVVDTGIHWKRWSREEALAYMDTTMPAPPGAYTGEVERYIAWPGQACGYKIGELKILELRDRARRELGSKFDIKKFHNILLQNGSMPLSTLEKVVENYIAGQR